MAALTLFSAAPFDIMAATKISGQSTATHSRSTSPGSAHSESEDSMQGAPVLPRAHPTELEASTEMLVESKSLSQYTAVDSIATDNAFPWPKDFSLPTGLLEVQLPTMLPAPLAGAPWQTTFFGLQQQALELGSDECPGHCPGHDIDSMGRRSRVCKLRGSNTKVCSTFHGSSCLGCVKKSHLKQKRTAFCSSYNGC
jgi:hypothetical protein